MNRHQLRGRIGQARGKVKEVTGRLFGNKPLEGKGHVEKAAGRMQADYGDIKNEVQKHV
jgi:uncharacterized protein YjbJ (UPF0337 family)